MSEENLTETNQNQFKHYEEEETNPNESIFSLLHKFDYFEIGKDSFVI